MDNTVKLRHTIDALFGAGAARHLPMDASITLSKTKRIKTVMHRGRLLCTLRIDGGVAITPYFAQIMLKGRSFRQNCIEVSEEAVPFIREGRSVFCKHVTWCGRNVQASADVPVLFDGEVIAVGRAVLSGDAIMDCQLGVAVKVRDSLKSSRTERKS